jgi:hypothetical protein
MESPASNSWKKRLITQDIFDEDFHKKIYHFELKDSIVGSMASGHIDKIISVKEFIDKIINNAEKILRSWGFDGNEFTTL